MLPVVAIVGRPNVGKSTLFNVLTGSRAALVADFPGLTRDRLFGAAHHLGRDFLLVDTGGLHANTHDPMDHLVREQTQQAIKEADYLLWLVDATTGVTPDDLSIFESLRRYRKKLCLVVNKVDNLLTSAPHAFRELGCGSPHEISAIHRQGLSALLDLVVKHFPDEPEVLPFIDPNAIKVAIIGRPNAGKSTLINRLLGETRVLVSDIAGTTRDSVYIPWQFRQRPMVLIDTAGMRRRARIEAMEEKFSVVKTAQAVADAHVVIVVLDAHAGMADQDAHLLGFTIEQGKSLIVAVNKWDGLDKNEKARVEDELDRKLSFVPYARRYYISALHGTNVGYLPSAVVRAYRSAGKRCSTSELTRLLESAQETHQPPMVRGRRIKLRFAHMGGEYPPTIVIHGTQATRLPKSYHRYLENFYRKALKLEGTPIVFTFKENKNPYVESD